MSVCGLLYNIQSDSSLKVCETFQDIISYSLWCLTRSVISLTIFIFSLCSSPADSVQPQRLFCRVDDWHRNDGDEENEGTKIDMMNIKHLASKFIFDSLFLFTLLATNENETWIQWLYSFIIFSLPDFSSVLLYEVQNKILCCNILKEQLLDGFFGNLIIQVHVWRIWCFLFFHSSLIVNWLS